MFSKQIINSARFIKMPTSSQLLYFHLSLNADDDGVVEGYNVMRMINCTEDDLHILVAKSFVIVLNEDLVTYITDWTEHNLIRPDRKVDSIYKNLLIKIIADGCPTNDRQLTDNGQHRVGKVSLGEFSSEKDNIVEELPIKEIAEKIPYKEIITYLNEQANKNFKFTGSKTKELINGRYSDGFTQDDFIKVIDIKCEEWLGDKKMEKFLQPSTLFCISKFEGYLNQEINLKGKKEPFKWADE